MWLRLGVLLSGRLIDERVMQRREHVTLGRSPRNRLPVPSDALPRRHRLFEAQREGWTLVLAPGMEARLASDDRLSLHRNAGRLVLAAGARGRIAIGDVVVLFQLLDAPPARPRPQLPPSLRRSLLHSIDWLLATLVLGSFALHFGCVGWLSTLDFPRTRDLDSPPPMVARFPTTRFVLPKPPAPAPPASIGSTPGRVAHHSTPAPARVPIDRARLGELTRTQGVLGVIGSRGPGGTLVDSLLVGNPPTDADEVFRNVGGVSTTASADRLLPRGTAPGTITRSTSLYATGPGEVATEARRGERAIELKDTAPIELEGDAPPDPAAIAREVRLRLGAIRACYERILRRESVGGKLTLRFEIDALGRPTAISVDEDTLRSPAVVDCIRERAHAWRLPPARGGFSFSYPFVFVAR